MSLKTNKTPLLQVLSLLFLIFGLAACDGKNEITMIKPGAGNGQGDKNCDKVFCKGARDTKADDMGSIAVQSTGWSEMILVEALGLQTKGTYSACINASKLSEDGKTLDFKSTGRNCTRGEDTVVSKLTANIERDSDQKVTKITVNPRTALDIEQAERYNLLVARDVKDNYTIETKLNLNIEIQRINSYTYSFTEKVDIKSDRRPDPEKLNTFSPSELVAETEISGRILLKTDGSLVVTELNIDSEKDSNNNYVNGGLQFAGVFSTEKRKRNENPLDFKSDLKIFEETDEVRVSNCGIMSDRYHYTAELYKTASGTDFKDAADYGSKDYMEINDSRIQAVIAKRTRPVSTCQNQITGRLFNVSQMLDFVFEEFHLNIGAKKMQSQTSRFLKGQSSSPQSARGIGHGNFESKPINGSNYCKVTYKDGNGKTRTVNKPADSGFCN